MSIKKIFPLILLLLSWVAQVNASSEITVHYSGCVEETSMIFKAKPSLLELLKQPNVQPCAYKFAAALMQSRLFLAQEAQKEALLITIQLLQLRSTSEVLKQYLRSLKALIQSQPVTGRVLGLELDSTRVEILPLQNRILSDSSKLYFPKKMKSVYFVGANKTQMLYRPVLTLDDYLKKNPLFDFFEKGHVYVVQANTDVEKLKVGGWNHQKQYVSPGAWVVGLLPTSVIEEIAPSFNEDLAQWLATQVLP